MKGLANTFKKFFTNKTTVTLLGVVLGVGVLVFSYIYRVNHSLNPIKVPVAKVELTATTKITKDDIIYVKVSSKFAKKADIITDTKSIVDKYVATGTSIPKGGMFYKSQVVEQKELPNAIFEKIDKNNTIYQLKVDSSVTYANEIYPNDQIDLYVVANLSGLFVYSPVIEGISVLAVRDSNGENIFDVTSGKKANWLLFEVEMDKFRLLKIAELQKGNIKIIPVPSVKGYIPPAGAIQYSSDELANIIENMAVRIGGTDKDE